MIRRSGRTRWRLGGAAGVAGELRRREPERAHDRMRANRGRRRGRSGPAGLAGLPAGFADAPAMLQRRVCLGRRGLWQRDGNAARPPGGKPTDEDGNGGLRPSRLEEGRNDKDGNVFFILQDGFF